MKFEEALESVTAESYREELARSYRRRLRARRRERLRKRGAAFGVACAAGLLALLPAPAHANTMRPVMSIHTHAETMTKRTPLHTIEGVTVTHYDVCTLCCGKDDGITSSGVQAVPYVTCAVDPAIIPLGADVIVDDGGKLHYYRAEDTGVTGNHVDICVSSHEEAVQLGVKRATVVYWMKGEKNDS